MNKKVVILTILIISLLLISACKGKERVPSTGFIGGKEGITAALSIESTSGGNKVFDTGVDPFKIDVTLTNKGEHDVAENEVLITLDGISLDAFSILDGTKENTLPLLGLKKEASGITEPSQAIVQYDANYKPDAEADRTANLVANYCYKYQTLSRVSNLCLKNRVTGPSQDSICKIDEQKLAENSGSPIKITKISQRPSGEQKVNVFILAENAGQGTIYKPDYLSKGECKSSDEDKNKINVKVELVDFLSQSSTMIKCSGLDSNQGLVNIIQNKVQLSCEIDTTFITQENAFETPLRVTFDYVYKDSVLTTLTIKSSI